MKSNNLWHIIWIIGIYAILVSILYLVIIYKVKWEDKDLNTYLYFYECSNNLCTTTEKIDNYYGSIVCKDDKCPYIISRYNNYVVLNDNGIELLYDYKNDKIINDEYISYKFSSSNDLIVQNKAGLYGIISVDGTVIIDPTYDLILDYLSNNIAYMQNGKVGIINTISNININPIYENIILINDKLYGYMEDNYYYIASYDTEVPVNNEKYDYLYSIDGIMLVIKDKKVDILGSNLKSKLVMKVETFYNYQIEKERESLNTYKEGSLLHFSIVNNDQSITNYIYDINNNKLFN